MRILALEASSMLGGAAIMDSTLGLMAEVRVNVKEAHSSRLMQQVDAMLKSIGMGMEEVDALVVAAGPGSFTGLRIAVATVKGLAFATGKPVVAVPTLEAYAYSFIGAGQWLVAPTLDARRKEVYCGAFEVSALGASCVIEVAPRGALEFAQLLKATGRQVILAGQGAIVYRDTFEAELAGVAHFAPPHLMAPSPAALAALGLMKAQRGEYADPVALAPLYLRKSEAELMKR